MENQESPVAPVNRKMKYYNAHKNEEAFKIRMRDAKKRYYERNREVIIEKVKARYRASKGIQPEPEIVLID